MKKINIFVSYSHFDMRWFEEGSFMPRLIKSLTREGVEIWYDKSRMTGGDRFRKEIEEAINKAHIAILLVSQDFLNSEFIRKEELPRIKDRADKESLVVLPILVGKCDWQSIPLLSKPIMVPGKPTPLIKYLESPAKWDDVQYEIYEAVKSQINKVRKRLTAPPPPPPPPTGGETTKVTQVIEPTPPRKWLYIFISVVGLIIIAGIYFLLIRPEVRKELDMKVAAPKLPTAIQPKKEVKPELQPEAETLPVPEEITETETVPKRPAVRYKPAIASATVQPDDKPTIEQEAQGRRSTEHMPSEVVGHIDRLRSRGSSPSGRLEAIRALRDIAHPSSIPVLIEQLIWVAGSSGSSHEASKALEAIGEPAVEPLIAALADKKKRARAVQALGQIKDPRAIQPLIDLLSTGDFCYVPDALHNIGPKAIEPLLLAIKDEDPTVRKNVAYALGGHKGQPRVVEALISLLKDDVSDVRENAASSLGSLGDTDAVEPLIAALDDISSSVRAAACWSLGRLEDQRAVTPLTKRLSDYSAEVRRNAARCLGKLRATEAVSDLVAVLKDHHFSVRNAVADALKDIGDPEAIDPLIETLSRETNPTCRRVISWALEALSGQNLGEDPAMWREWRRKSRNTAPAMND